MLSLKCLVALVLALCLAYSSTATTKSVIQVPAYADTNSPDYPACEILCEQRVNFGAIIEPIHYNMNRDLSSTSSDPSMSSNITANIEGKSLIITVSSPVEGTFNIALRQFLKAQQEDGTRIAYRVLLDGSEDSASFRELGREDLYREFDRLEKIVRSSLLVREPNAIDPITVDSMRVLSIDFPSGSHSIEIRGTSIYYAAEVGHRHDTKDIFVDFPQYSCDILCDYDLRIGDESYPIAYGLYGDGNSVEVTGISADVDRKTITVDLDTAGFGTFHIFLPRSIIQSSQDDVEVSYLVKLDGNAIHSNELDWQQIFPSDPFKARLLFIDFPKDTKRIEIMGTWTIGEKSAHGITTFPCDTLEKNCTYDLTILDKTFQLNYAISGYENTSDKQFPRFSAIYSDMVHKSIRIQLEAPDQGGILAIDLPPDLIRSDADVRRYSTYQDFVVTNEHKNIIKSDSRIIEVKFDKGQKEIEIGGNYLYRSNEESLFSPTFPCSKDACSIRTIGRDGAEYDLQYHITGTVVTGFPDEVKVNSISIDSTKPSLKIDITAKQPGRFDMSLDKTLAEKELSGDEGINYFAYVEGREAISNYTSTYFPDRPRTVTIDFLKGDKRIEVVGVPMQQYPCSNPAEFCLMKVQVKGETYPIVLSFSGGSALAAQKAVSIDQILQAHAGHIHLPVASNLPVLSIDGISIGGARESIVLDITVRRDGMLTLYPAKDVIKGNITTVKVDGRTVEYGSDSHDDSIGIQIPVLVDSRQVELVVASAASIEPTAPDFQDVGRQPTVSEPIPENSASATQNNIIILKPQGSQDFMTPYTWTFIGVAGAALTILTVKLRNESSFTRRFLGETKRMLPAALGIEIICATSAETGSIIGILLFGFTTIGFITSFLLAYGVAGCTAFVSIVGRARSREQSYHGRSEEMTCGCDAVLAHGSDMGFISAVGLTFKYFASGLRELPSLYRAPHAGRIIKTGLFILITAESACIVTTATVDFFLYQYSLFLSIPLALVSGAIVVALIAAYKSARRSRAYSVTKTDWVA